MSRLVTTEIAQHLNDLADELELAVNVTVGALRFEAARLEGGEPTEEKSPSQHLEAAYNAVRMYDDQLDGMDTDLDEIEKLLAQNKKKPN